jgi:ATP-dependent Lhr-like helicase
VWVGGGASGPRDGRVSLFLTEHLDLLPDPREDRPTGATHERIREALASRGALFFPQLQAAIGGGFTPEVLEALWDLVWSGEVTNDTLQPLRGLFRPSSSRGRRRAAQRSIYPTRASLMLSAQRATTFTKESAGRWSLVDALRTNALTPTERVTARVRQLLERHGVLTREAVQAEGLSGGFAAVYGVLKAMEDAGRVRRGYFVAGRGATQFALPGAVDRLRTVRESSDAARVTTLAASDPANLYGAALPWPERVEGRRPMRAAGALVILVDGALAAWLSRDERALLTFIDGDEHDVIRTRGLVAEALAAEAGPDRRTPFFLDEIDGLPVDESSFAEPLREAGFVRTPRGYLRRGA